MGCSNSKIDTVESVARYKKRKSYIKQAVSHRHAFAAAQAAYIQSLKNSGAAIRQFADADTTDATNIPQTPNFPRVPELLPPPPLPPVSEDIQSSPPRSSLSLPRATSMPPLNLRSTGASPVRSPLVAHPRTVSEGEEDRAYVVPEAHPPPRLPQEPKTIPLPPSPKHDMDVFGFFDPMMPGLEDVEGETFEAKTPERENGGGRNEGIEHKEEERPTQYKEQTPEPEPKKVELKPSPVIAERESIKTPPLSAPRTMAIPSKKDMVKILDVIDEWFLKCYEAGKEVAILLQAHKKHYPPVPIENINGIKEHHERVSNILAWGKSSSKAPLSSKDVPISSHNDDDDDDGSHASTLDKLLAWEKKLYEEVKAGEAIKLELEKRSTQLKRQKERGEAAATIEKTKALVKSLETRHLVQFQAVDSATSEVLKLRDECLYPHLVKLVKGLKQMWKAMFEGHSKQFTLVANFIVLEFPSTAGIGEFHRKITEELDIEINNWHQSLGKLTTTQKDYIAALYEWLQLNIKQIETEVKDNLASTQKLATPPVHHLCKAWMEALKSLSCENVLKELKIFSSTLREMMSKQAEEMKQKKRCESLAKDLEKKKISLEIFERKYKEKHGERQVPRENQELVTRNPVQERKVSLELLNDRLAE